MSPEWESKLIISWGWDWTSGSASDVLSSANMTQLGDYDLMRSEPWHSPLLQGMVSDVHRPVANLRTMSWGVHEVDDGWKGSLENRWPKCCWGAWGSGSGIWIQVLLAPLTSQMVLHSSSLCRIPSNIWGLEFSSEDSAVEYEFYLIFLALVADDRGRGSWLNSLSYHICIVGCVVRWLRTRGEFGPNARGSYSWYAFREMTLSTGYRASHLWLASSSDKS